MGATLRKLDDAPILIVTHEGFLDLRAVELATSQVAQFLQELPIPLYGVIDLSAAMTDFPQMLRILYHQSRSDLGTLSEGENRVVIVGSHPLIRIFRKLFRLEEFGGRIVPIFSTQEDAIAALRVRIEAEALRQS